MFALAEERVLCGEEVGSLRVGLFACVCNDMVVYYFSPEPLNCSVHKQIRV